MLKALDLPFGKYRDKGTPVDNLSNYDSSGENILYAAPLSEVVKGHVVFATRSGQVKLVDGVEFEVSKRTTAATKLAEGDEVMCAGIVNLGDSLVLQTEKNYFLRLNAMEIPQQKKAALGVRGIQLSDQDQVTMAAIVTPYDQQTVMVGEKEVNLNRLRVGKRGTRGTKR
jgi:DNA gyrase subunit A